MFSLESSPAFRWQWREMGDARMGSLEPILSVSPRVCHTQRRRVCSIVQWRRWAYTRAAYLVPGMWFKRGVGIVGTPFLKLFRKSYDGGCGTVLSRKLLQCLRNILRKHEALPKPCTLILLNYRPYPQCIVKNNNASDRTEHWRTTIYLAAASHTLTRRCLASTATPNNSRVWFWRKSVGAIV